MPEQAVEDKTIPPQSPPSGTQPDSCHTSISHTYTLVTILVCLAKELSLKSSRIEEQDYLKGSLRKRYLEVASVHQIVATAGISQVLFRNCIGAFGVSLALNAFWHSPL